MREFLLTFAGEVPVLEASNQIDPELVGLHERVIGYCENGPGVMGAILAHPKVRLMCGENWYWGMALAERGGSKVDIIDGMVRAAYIAETDLTR